MGCSPSGLAFVSKQNDKHRMPEVQRNSVHGFTDHEKALIKKTWRVVSNNMPGVGAKIFLKIFSLRPQVKQIFPCRDVTGEDLLRDTHFRGHASRFMQAVGAAVDNINDLDQAMAPLLFGLGTQHIHYMGFKPEYFDIFIVAILEVFAEELGSKYTEGVATAWRRVVEFIISKLKEGYVHALEKERLD